MSAGKRRSPRRPCISRLLDDVASGEDVVITRRGEPAARLVSAGPRISRRFGLDRGRLVVPEDFDAPLDCEVLDSFEA
ncbi:MAG: type II toxin-antitoxin system Phd/YefM family antitoxin [Acidimicrobiales bacterium]